MIVIVCLCVTVRRRRRCVCRVLGLVLVAQRCVAVAAMVFRCMRRVVGAMASLLNCAAPGLLVYNNIVVNANFKLTTKINRLHLTITAHQP